MLKVESHMLELRNRQFRNVALLEASTSLQPHTIETVRNESLMVISNRRNDYQTRAGPVGKPFRKKKTEEKVKNGKQTRDQG